GRGYRFTGDVRQFANEALTVERESFSRLTVQQEEIESTSSVGMAGSRIHEAFRRVTSHPLLLSSLAIAIVLLAGGGLWLRSLRGNPSAPLPWSNISMRRFAVHGGVPFRVAISPDGKSIAYAQQIKGKSSLWLGQVETNGSAMIDPAGATIYN